MVFFYKEGPRNAPVPQRGPPRKNGSHQTERLPPPRWPEAKGGCNPPSFFFNWARSARRVGFRSPLPFWASALSVKCGLAALYAPRSFPDDNGRRPLPPRPAPPVWGSPGPRAPGPRAPGPRAPGPRAPGPWGPRARGPPGRGPSVLASLGKCGRMSGAGRRMSSLRSVEGPMAKGP